TEALAVAVGREAANEIVETTEHGCDDTCTERRQHLLVAHAGDLVAVQCSQRASRAGAFARDREGCHHAARNGSHCKEHDRELHGQTLMFTMRRSHTQPTMLPTPAPMRATMPSALWNRCGT